MTPTVRQEKQKAWEKMNEKLTAAARIYRKFTQGIKTPKGNLPDPVKAFSIARDRRASLITAMHESDPPLAAADCAVALVYSCPSAPPKLHTLVDGKETEVLTAMLECGATAVGLVFALKDREKPRHFLWAQPFALTEEVLGLMNQALDSQADKVWAN